MKLSENFTFEELTASYTAAKKGIDNTPDEKAKENLMKLAANILQPLREAYGRPITVTSGYRCKELNNLVGGVKTSQHIKGEAADIICADNRFLFNLALKLINDGKIKVGQIIDEKNYRWIHISLPNGKHLNSVLHL